MADNLTRGYVIVEEDSTSLANSTTNNASSGAVVHFILENFSILGQIISIACLGVTFLLYALLPTLRSPQGYCIANMAASLGVQQLVFLLGSDLTDYPVMCKIIAATNHYFWLASFFWMNAIAINTWWSLTNHNNSKLTNMKVHYVAFTLYGWLAPLLFVGIYIALNPSTEGMTLCFLTDQQNLLLYLVAPTVTILVGSLMVYFHYIQLSCKGTSVGKGRRQPTLSQQLRNWRMQVDSFYLVQVIVFLTMGINIVTEYSRIVIGSEATAAISVISTMSQGIVINIIYAAKKSIYSSVFASCKKCIAHTKAKATKVNQPLASPQNHANKEGDSSKTSNNNYHMKYDDDRQHNYRQNHSLLKSAPSESLFPVKSKGVSHRLHYINEMKEVQGRKNSLTSVSNRSSSDDSKEMPSTSSASSSQAGPSNSSSALLGWDKKDLTVLEEEASINLLDNSENERK